MPMTNPTTEIREPDYITRIVQPSTFPSGYKLNTPVNFPQIRPEPMILHNEEEIPPSKRKQRLFSMDLRETEPQPLMQNPSQWYKDLADRGYANNQTKEYRLASANLLIPNKDDEIRRHSLFDEEEKKKILTLKPIQQEEPAEEDDDSSD